MRHGQCTFRLDDRHAMSIRRSLRPSVQSQRNVDAKDAKFYYYSWVNLWQQRYVCFGQTTHRSLVIAFFSALEVTSFIRSSLISL